MDKELKFEATMNPETKESKVSVLPEPKTFEEVLLHLTNVINASAVMLQNLLSCLPTIREVTEEEQALNTYIYTSDSDRKVIEWRKRMHDDTKKVFDTVLDNMFVDVVYTDACKKHYENLVFDEGEKAAEEYREKVEKLRIELLDRLIQEAKEETTDVKSE